ncbi:hypothetical protein ACS0TY_028688 [Phlomoides rotata]
MQAYLISRLSRGFVTFLLSAFMLLAWIFYYPSTKYFGHQSLRCFCQANSMLRGHFDTLPNILSILWRIYYCILIEKMGMTGSHPPPHGYFIPDVIVAGVIGLVTGWCFGPLLPIVGKSLAKPSIIQVLLHGSIVALALSSQFFPYSNNAPKRIILQHSIQTTEEAIPASEKEVTSSGNQDNEYDGIIVTTDNDLLNVSVCEQSFVLPMESMTMISSSYDVIIDW